MGATRTPVSEALQNLNGPVLLTPTGACVSIPDEVVDAILDFKNNKHTGSVQIQFRDGGIAGVKASYEKSYSRQNQKTP